MTLLASALAKCFAGYHCDEASGNLLDSINSYDFTAVNSPGSAAGKIGTSRSFVAASNQYFTRISNAVWHPSTLHMCGWVYSDSTTGSRSIVTRLSTPVGNYCWNAFLLTGTNQLIFRVYPNGDNSAPVTATGPAVPLNTWTFVECGYSETLNIVWSGLAGSRVSTEFTASIFAANAPVWFGRLNTGAINNWSGRLDEFYFADQMFTDTELNHAAGIQAANRMRIGMGIGMGNG